MRKYLLLLAAAALLAAPRANAFVATTGADVVMTPDPDRNNVADKNERFTVGLGEGGALTAPTGTGLGVTGAATAAGTFAMYDPAPGDPPLNNHDLALYRYILDGVVSNVAGAVTDYTGRYLVFYDQNANGKAEGTNTLPAGDFIVSAGTFTAAVNFAAGPVGAVTGTLTQDVGPTVQPFANFGAMFGSVPFTGTYTPVITGQGLNNQGTLQMTLNGGNVIPEPGTLALLGTGLLPLLGLRRRK